MTDPVVFAPGRLQKFLDWIDFELTYARGARAGLERQWRDWLRQYRPAATQPLKRWPFEGASNEILPITAIDVDQLYASFMQTLHAADDLWSVEALNERWEPVAKPLQDFLTVLDRSVLKMYQVNRRAVLEMVKLGTAIYKHGWTYESRPIIVYDDAGKRQRVTRRISRPFVDHVALPDLVIPPYATALQPDDQGGAPWIAERLRVDIDRLKSLVNASVPLMPMVPQEIVDRIVLFEEHQQTEHRAAIQDLDYIKRNTTVQINFDKDSGVESTKSPGGLGAYVRDVELWEIHCRFATQGTSQDDLIVTYHPPTRTIVRGIVNPYHHGQRPYEVIRYFPGDGFYGIGVCEQKEVFQRVISDLYNFQQDNVLLANSRGFVTSEGSGLGPGEPIFPGMVKVVSGDVRSAWSEFRLGEIYPSLPQLIGFVQQIGERRTSVSDLQLGTLQNLPSRTPASTTQALLQEGRRRPDLTLKDMRYSGIGTLGLRLVQLIQQYATTMEDVDGQRWLQIAMDTLGLPEGRLVAEKLATPTESAELGLGVSIYAVSGTSNKDLEKQRLMNLVALNGQQAPIFLQLMQAAQQAQGTPLGAVALDVARSQAELLRRIYEQEDFRNVEAMVPEIPPAEALQPPGPVPGGNPGAQNPADLGGLAGLLQGFGSPVASGNGSPAPGAPA